MKGAAVYDDKTKDTWRGWKWNSIAHAALGFNDRLPPSERARRLSQKTVLYLVGPEDHDRKRALAKGFAYHNTIAVDLVQHRVDEVRSYGGLAICGSLQQIVMNWPHDWPIDVIDADLCHGMVSDVAELPKCLMLCPAFHSESVLSLNLMRGRDSHSNLLRQSLEKCREFLGNNKPEYDVVKHRASNWLMNLAITWIDAQGGAIQVGTNLTRVAMDAKYVRTFFESVRPVINSYRSKTSGQWFDSVVHRWGCQTVPSDGAPREEWLRMREYVSEGLSKTCGIDDGLRSRIAALRAVRTVKMRGQ